MSILFAAFLGYNPIQSLVGTHVLSQLSAANASALTGRQFFPELISGPFAAGLHQAFTFSLVVCLIAAVASWSRGGAGRQRRDDDRDRGAGALTRRGYRRVRAGPVSAKGTWPTSVNSAKSASAAPSSDMSR